MKQLTLTLGDALHASAELEAMKAGKPLTSLLTDWIRQFASGSQSDFDRLAQEKDALREQLRRRRQTFSARDRLTRDELHSRHAVH